MKKLILTTTLVAIAATGAQAKWYDGFETMIRTIDHKVIRPAKKGIDHLHCKREGGDVPNWLCHGPK